jgi:hypothetical protein
MAPSLLKNEHKIKQQSERWIKRKERLSELRHKVLNGGSIPSMVVDTACTSTVVRPEEAKHVQILHEKSTKIFHNANGTLSKADNKALLHLPLREPAKSADIVPGLALNTLLSGPKLADANYIAIFTQEEVQIFDAETAHINVQGKTVLRGWCCPQTKLWRVPLKQQWPDLTNDTALLNESATKILMKMRGQKNHDEVVNSVNELPNLQQVVRWYHAAAGYPIKASWLKAIEAGFFATWPLLMAKAVKKHYLDTDITLKGLMKRVKLGIRSTKEPEATVPEIDVAEARLRELHKKHCDVLVHVTETADMIYTDKTGRFPTVSSRGHKYIMFFCEVDGNYIALKPMRSREEKEMIKTYNSILDRLAAQGIKPKHQMLDNKASKEYLKTIENRGMTLELAPPGNHRRNLAEKMIQTGKNHITSNPIGCVESFPMREWDRLLPQMEITLNMFRPSNVVVPTISAHSYVHGVHDYVQQNAFRSTRMQNTMLCIPRGA